MTKPQEIYTCPKCGGEGHLVCRPNIYTLTGDLYTVDCEHCDNTTDDEYPKREDAISNWNAQ